MWGQWTPTVADIKLLTDPKSADYAEIGWTELDNKDYDNFVKRLKPLANEWQDQGINIYEFKELK